jgi:hypothetical protein
MIRKNHSIKSFNKIGSRSATRNTPNVRHVKPDAPRDRMPNALNLIALIATLSSADAITATYDIFQPINRGRA